MAKIILGKPPKSFKRVVTFPMLDGTDGKIEIEYKYRTRKDFGTFVDGMLENAKGAAPSVDEAFSMEKLMERTSDANAKYLMEVVEGWNLDAEFSEETVQQLANECPAAVTSIMESYRAGCVEGRLGN